ncbi:MAG: DUF2256 domain-containing protein [Lysobacteraceae bacterium]
MPPARESRRAPRPQKPCARCGRPFQWRRKWARCWDQVVFCSQRCRGGGSRADDQSRD